MGNSGWVFMKFMKFMHHNLSWYLYELTRPCQSVGWRSAQLVYFGCWRPPCQRPTLLQQLQSQDHLPAPKPQLKCPSKSSFKPSRRSWELRQRRKKKLLRKPRLKQLDMSHWQRMRKLKNLLTKRQRSLASPTGLTKPWTMTGSPQQPNASSPPQMTQTLSMSQAMKIQKIIEKWNESWTTFV